MKHTLKDVAREAGVSQMTVSRVINNTGSIAAATRTRVLGAIRKLDYKPNGIARSLVRNKTGLIGLIVPDINNPFFSAMVKQVEKVARAHEYNILLGDTGGDVDIEVSYIDLVLQRMLDGVLLAAPRMEDSRLARYNAAVPLVVIDRRVEGTGMQVSAARTGGGSLAGISRKSANGSPSSAIPQVLVDDARGSGIPQVWADDIDGARQAMEHLINLGHRRIGFLSGPENVQVSRMREQGYRAALEANNILFDSDLFIRGDFLFKSGYRSLNWFLGLSSPPTAVFCSNDMMALGLLKRAKEKGIDIPKDLSVAGFDDIELSSLISPPLTTVHHPISEMGQKGLHLLLGRLSGGPVGPATVKLSNHLVVRESTGGEIRFL